MIHNKTNAEILKEFDKRVIGHNKAKKALITLVNRSKLAHHYKYIAEMYGEESADIDTMSCLLIGPSGNGKTFLVKTLQDIVDFPLVYVDSTRLEPAGGASSFEAKNILQLVYDNASRLVGTPNNNYHSVDGTIDQTVVFIDEVDKIAKAFESSGQWNAQIQSGLLGILESQEGFDKVSFVLAGAFQDLYGKEDITEKKNTIGFHSEPHKEEEVKDITDKDVIKYGLKPELVGRINKIVAIDTLTDENLVEILLNITLPEKVQQLKVMGIDCPETLDKDQIDTIIKKVRESNQGVRSLKREVSEYFDELEFNYEDIIRNEPKQLNLKL